MSTSDTVKITTESHPGLLEASRRLFSAHSADPNFTGCGIGFRRRGGQVTSEPVVIAMVANKLPAGALSRRRLLPATIGGGGQTWGVDVVEVPRPAVGGPKRAAGTKPAAGAPTVRPDGISYGGPISGQERPPLQGCSISNASADDQDGGTFGCYVLSGSPGPYSPAYVLSTNYVLARMDQANLGESIIQPGAMDGGTESLDTVATLTSFVPLGTGAPTVDAALALYTGDGTGGDYTPDVANDLMEPISETHPAVGMVVASDWEANTFLCTMDNVLGQLECQMLAATPENSCTAAPVVGMNIEKVGRTSGYSSSTVDAVGVQVLVAYFLDANNTLLVTFSDLIWSQFFAAGNGDEGAVACQGGNGDTYVLPQLAPCPLLQNIEDYYGFSATNDNALTNQLQEQFLTQSACGNLVIGLVYLNAQVAIDRLQADQGDAYNQPAAQAFMQQYYEEYRPQLAAVLASQDPDTVITDQNIADLEMIISEVGGSPATGVPDGEGLLTQDESNAVVQLFFSLAIYTIGLNYQQLLAYMNEPSTYNTAFDILAGVPTIAMP